MKHKPSKPFTCGQPMNDWHAIVLSVVPEQSDGVKHTLVLRQVVYTHRTIVIDVDGKAVVVPADLLLKAVQMLQPPNQTNQTKP